MINLVPVGMALILLGFVIVFIGALLSGQQGSTNTKVAVGGFIGPIPFGFGNDKKLMYSAIGLSVFVFVMWVLMNKIR
ncbi:DUF131 domain-containing protein [Candidatus Woesearchaeota archaeon]|nr:DUF131 domain-containing protein [Candidatus Woesearchaeota archaeon]